MQIANINNVYFKNFRKTCSSEQTILKKAVNYEEVRAKLLNKQIKNLKGDIHM